MGMEKSTALSLVEVTNAVLRPTSASPLWISPMRPVHDPFSSLPQARPSGTLSSVLQRTWPWAQLFCAAFET